MSLHKRSLSNTKGKDTSKRAKPLTAGAGYTKGRTPYRCGGRVKRK